jgi:photosystem II stability/assembly factor-like uncharacterized protein
MRRILLLLLATSGASLRGQTLATSPFAGLAARNIGPAALGGRIHDIEVPASDPSVIYVASASGGIWKSTNKGSTWAPIFEGQATNTFGDLAIFAGNASIVWAGTGEQNNRQSTSWGNGVYRSTDAGRTWTSIGLEKTRHIGRVRLHPSDPNTAWVAALGDLWKPTVDRGVFKTTDAGRSWTKTLYVDSLTGAVDLVIDPSDPNVLYAATYQRLRTPWGFNGGGPGSGIWKSIDGGATWSRLTTGLPSGDIGRIGLAISQIHGRVLVATIEHATESGTYRTQDGGQTWIRMSRVNPRPMYYSHIFLDPTNDQRVWILAEPILKSEDGGRTFRRMPTSPSYDLGLHSDFHSLWIDPRDTRHIITGSDGGLGESYDRGETYARFSNLPIAQLYSVGADNRDPYWVYIGLQDNHSWMGPSATRHWLGITNDDWREIGFGDGMVQQPDPSNPRIVYTSGQNASVTRFDIETGDRLDIHPVPPPGDSAYRWDWTAPMLASRHTPGTFYLGGNRLFITRDRGVTWTRTPDLTRQIQRDTLRIMGVPGKDIRISRHDGENSFSELTTISESPLDAKVLWVGSDDGNIQVSRDGGLTWNEVSAKVPDVPNGTFVSRVLASSAGRGVAYATFDGHRSGDFTPFVFRTTDFGATWVRLTSGIAADHNVRSIQEYPGQPGLVFAGTERALYVSTDTARSWSRYGANLPTTRYDDIQIHPRTKDLLLATHGRSLWIVDDVSPLATWTATVSAGKPRIFPARSATLFQYWQDFSYLGASAFAGPNPADGALITYYLPQGVAAATLSVVGADGKVVRRLTVPATAGLQRTSWDLRHEPPPAERNAEGEEEEPTALPIPPRSIGERGPFVAPGTYTLRLEGDGVKAEGRVSVIADPKLPITIAQHREREAFLLQTLALQREVFAFGADLAKLRAEAQSRRDSATAGSQERTAAEDRLTKLNALDRSLRVGQGALRGRIGGLAGDFNGAGAQQGSLYPPTASQRQELTAITAALRKAQRELAALR